MGGGEGEGDRWPDHKSHDKTGRDRIKRENRVCQTAGAWGEVPRGGKSLKNSVLKIRKKK